MAGFPNAAEEAGDEPLNLHRLLVKSPASTFFMRVDSDLHHKMNIFKGDLLVIDRSLEMRSGDVVVAHNRGEFVIKRFINRGKGQYLLDGSSTQPLRLDEGGEGLQIWGVVPYVIHNYRGSGL